MDYSGFVIFVLLSLILGGFGQTPPDCCLNDLCPYYCVRCDGTAQCFDLSDELGCSSDGDKKLNSFSKPPIFVPFVLKTITSQLRKEKEAVASRFPNRQCIRSPNTQNKPRNTYRTDTNEREEPEDGWSLRVMKFRTETTTSTTEAPIWLQLLRKLQYEKQTPTTTTTTTPAPSTTTDPPWLALLKNLIQVVKGNSTTTQPQVVSTEQQPQSWQTEPILTDTESVSESVTVQPSTTEMLMDTSTTAPATPFQSSTTTSSQNLTSTYISMMSTPGDPLSTSARLISSLANENISTSFPVVVTQSSQTPSIEPQITTKIARITTTHTLGTTTDISPKIVSQSDMTSQVYDLSTTPESNLSREMSTEIERLKILVSTDMNNKNAIPTDLSSSTSGTSTRTIHSEASTENLTGVPITRTTHSEVSTENVTGVPIQFDLITTESLSRVINITHNATSLWNAGSRTVTEVTSVSVTEDGPINVTMTSINDTKIPTNDTHLEKLGWNDTLNVTESTVVDITNTSIGNVSNGTTPSFEDIINTSTHDTMDSTFTTSTDAPSIQSNIMQLIDKLLSKINETESEFSNSTSSTTAKFPVELKHFYTNFTVNDTDITEMKQSNISSSEPVFITESTPRVGLIEIAESTTSISIPPTTKDIAATANDTSHTNNSSNLDVNTSVYGEKTNVTILSNDRVTNQENNSSSTAINLNDVILTNSSEMTSEKSKLLSNITPSLTTVIYPDGTAITTESEVDILLKEVRKTLNETRSRITNLAEQIHSLDSNSTETNTTFRTVNRENSSKNRFFKYGLLTDFQADNGFSNFTVDRPVRVKPILQESNQRDTVTETITKQQTKKVDKPTDSTPMSWIYQTTSFPFDNFWDTITSQSPLLDSVFNPMPSNTIWSSLFDTWSLGTIGVPSTPRQENFNTLPTSTSAPAEMTTNSHVGTTPQMVPEAPTQRLPQVPTQRLTQLPTQRLPQVPTETPSQVPTRRLPRVPTQRLSQIPTETPSQVPTHWSTQASTETPSQTSSQTQPKTPTQRSQETPNQTPEQTPTETIPTSTVSPVTYLQTEPPLANGVQVPVIRTQDYPGITEVNTTGPSTRKSTRDEIYFVLKQKTTSPPIQTPRVTDPSYNMQIAFVTDHGVNFDNETNAEINSNFTISNIPVVTPTQATGIYSNADNNLNRIGNVRIISSVAEPETTTLVPVSMTPYSTITDEIFVIKPTSQVTTPTPPAPTTMLPSATTNTMPLLKNKSQMSSKGKSKDKSRQDWWDQAFQPTTWFPFETQYPTNTPIPWNTLDKDLATNIDPVPTTTVPNDVGCLLLQDASAFCKDLYSGQYKNPDDCKTYFVCDWGDLYRCHCPPNTLFDGKLRVCNWDYAVTC